MTLKKIDTVSLFAYFLVVWTLLLFLNKAVGYPVCWYYSDRAGEFAFSEIVTLLLYLLSSALLLRLSFKYKKYYLIAAAIFVFWLLLEEANYGQIFWGESSTNYYHDKEQISLHTALLRPVYLTRTIDLAEILSFILVFCIVLAGPLILKFLFKLQAPWYALFMPFALILFVYIGELGDFLIPWRCGWDAMEEIIETIMASAVFYFVLLFRIHLKYDTTNKEA